MADEAFDDFGFGEDFGASLVQVRGIAQVEACEGSLFPLWPGGGGGWRRQAGGDVRPPFWAAI